MNKETLQKLCDTRLALLKDQLKRLIDAHREIGGLKSTIRELEGRLGVYEGGKPKAQQRAKVLQLRVIDGGKGGLNH